MNEYQLPEEPAGPVWDQHGSRWVRIPETYPVLWKTDDDACHPTWGRLLEEYGPTANTSHAHHTVFSPAMVVRIGWRV